MNKIDYKQITDFLIDFLCDSKGLEETIDLLISGGFNEEELEELGFDTNDILEALKKRE